MNTTTLRGVFPEPKPVHRRNFMRENIRHLKEMQGLMQEQKSTVQTSPNKLNKFRNVSSRVYSNLNTVRKLPTKEFTRSSFLKPQEVRAPVRSVFVKNRSDLTQKIVHRGVQTERPEDVPKLYETGIIKFPTNTVPALRKAMMPKTGQGDTQTEKVTKNMQKLSIDDKPNYIKENIKNIKAKSTNRLEAPDPTQPPPTYKKGAVPKYLKKGKEEDKEIRREEEVKTLMSDGSLSNLVLLPDDERKEYLRVARESKSFDLPERKLLQHYFLDYASLIKELNSMPVSNDTLKKRKRKMEIEEELERLDEVIKVFQKPKVFVKADA